jgi:hypothetical protein
MSAYTTHGESPLALEELENDLQSASSEQYFVGLSAILYHTYFLQSFCMKMKLDTWVIM